MSFSCRLQILREILLSILKKEIQFLEIVSTKLQRPGIEPGLTGPQAAILSTRPTGFAYEIYSSFDLNFTGQKVQKKIVSGGH